jgi:hypothetical protein
MASHNVMTYLRFYFSIVMLIQTVFQQDTNFTSTAYVILVRVNSDVCFSCITVHYKVKCSEDTMLVELVKTESTSDIYLEQLKHYPGKSLLQIWLWQGVRACFVFEDTCLRIYLSLNAILAQPKICPF